MPNMESSWPTRRRSRIRKRETMNAGNRNRRNRQRASAHQPWSQLLGVAFLFLVLIPRCVGCRSPVDPLIEKYYGGRVESGRVDELDAATKEFLQEMIRRDSQR